MEYRGCTEFEGCLKSSLKEGGEIEFETVGCEDKVG